MFYRTFIVCYYCFSMSSLHLPGLQHNYGTLQEVRELIVSGEDPNPHTVSPLNH